MPIRRTRSGCCARAASGHTAAPQTIVMKSRRLIASPEAQTEHRNCSNWRARRGRNAAMSALGQNRTFGNVRAMSALPQKADIAVGKESSLKEVTQAQLGLDNRQFELCALQPCSSPGGIAAVIVSYSAL